MIHYVILLSKFHHLNPLMTLASLSTHKFNPLLTFELSMLVHLYFRLQKKTVSIFVRHAAGGAGIDISSVNQLTPWLHHAVLLKIFTPGPNSFF